MKEMKKGNFLMQNWFNLFPKNISLSIYVWVIMSLLPFYFIFSVEYTMGNTARYSFNRYFLRCLSAVIPIDRRIIVCLCVDYDADQCRDVFVLWICIFFTVHCFFHRKCQT